MTVKGENLADERENKKNLNHYCDIALVRRKRAQADGRTDEGEFRKTNRACRRCYDGADGPEPVEKRLLHFAVSISVTVIAPPAFSALNFTLSPALTLSSMAGSFT